MATRKNTKDAAQEYSGSSIMVLTGLDPVRKRPGMYIGGTGTDGLHHLVWEIVDNGVDEAAAGWADRIEIVLHDDGSVTVTDNGRGIPVDREPTTGKSAVELVFCELHAGGKFGGGGYAASGGLHGVGASVVNALSSRLEVEVDRDGFTWHMGFRQDTVGVWDAKGTKFTAKDGIRKGTKTSGTGTRVRFWPDRDIFDPGARFDAASIVERARQVSFLVPGLTIVVDDRQADGVGRQELCSSEGIADLVEWLSSGDRLCDVIRISGTGSYTEKIPVPVADGRMETREVEREMVIDVALRWVAGWELATRSFVNTIVTPKGGTHTQGFERALTRVVNEALRDTRTLKDKEDNATRDDISEGLVAVVKATIVEPQFEGQTKEVLGTPAAAKIAYDVTAEALRDWFRRNAKRQAGRTVLTKVANASRARVAARQQRETARRKSALESSSLPAKLADCRTKDVARSELHIIEGDSAAGCFTGDTPVACIDRDRTMAELAEDWDRGVAHLGWAADEGGDPVLVALSHPRLTAIDAEVVSVALDDKTVLRCTPDHLFRLHGGGWVAAGELTVYTQLATLGTRRTGTGEVWVPSAGAWQGVAPGARGVLTAGDDPGVRTVVAVGVAGRADVYDITVDGLANFAVSARCGGVFVHNSAKGARDSEFQALLPIRGKILNAAKASTKAVLDNAECAGLITAIGGGAGRNFDLESVRYGRIITLCDADVDGAHIRTLLLTFFYHWMRPLLAAGRIYSAIPPLFEIPVRGQPARFAYSDAERDEILAELADKGINVNGADIKRYKGLGEMNPDQLAVTTMDPDTRRLRRVRLRDGEAAAAAFDVLMGSVVEPRRRYIAEHSDMFDRDRLDV